MMFTPTTVSLPNGFCEDRPIWIAKNYPAATVGEIGTIAEYLEFDDSTATYRLRPIPQGAADDIFISAVIRSVPVTLRATIRGWIDPLPLEEGIDNG